MTEENADPGEDTPQDPITTTLGADEESGPNIEALASEEGHENYDDFIARGGKPSRYQPPEIFMALKAPLAKIKEQGVQLELQQKDFNRRLEGLNSYHGQQLESQKSQLIQQRDAAITDLDADQAHAYQDQIDNLPQAEQVTEPAQQISQDLNTWNNDPKNDWFKAPGPKQVYASNQFEAYRSQGYDDSTSIRLMESDIGKHFPDINQNIKGAPMAEGGSKPGAKAPAPEITMKSLTQEEASIWKNSPQMWKDEKSFLRSVKDSRSGE